MRSAQARRAPASGPGPPCGVRARLRMRRGHSAVDRHSETGSKKVFQNETRSFGGENRAGRGRREGAMPMRHCPDRGHGHATVRSQPMAVDVHSERPSKRQAGIADDQSSSSTSTSRRPSSSRSASSARSTLWRPAGRRRHADEREAAGPWATTTLPASSVRWARCPGGGTGGGGHRRLAGRRPCSPAIGAHHVGDHDGEVVAGREAGRHRIGTRGERLLRGGHRAGTRSRDRAAGGVGLGGAVGHRGSRAGCARLLLVAAPHPATTVTQPPARRTMASCASRPLSISGRNRV